MLSVPRADPTSPCISLSRRDDKLSSDEAVKRVLAGEKGDARGRAALTSRPQESDDRNSRDEEPRVPGEKEVTAGRRAGARQRVLPWFGQRRW